MAIQPQNATALKFDTWNEKTAAAGLGILAQVTAKEGINYLTSVGGTANAITASLVPAHTAYVAGQMFYLKPASANTGSATLNINGIAAKTIKTTYGAALVGGELQTTGIYQLLYDGTDLILLNPSAPVQTWAPSSYTASGGSWSAVSASDAQYVIDGKVCFLSGKFVSAGGFSAGTYIEITGLPASPSVASRTVIPCSVKIDSTSRHTAAVGEVLSNSIRIYEYDGSQWAATSACSVFVGGGYLIA